MVYIKQLRLPDEDTEMGVILSERRTCFPTVYPFKIFPQKQIRWVDFAPITIFYGGNGSGKTTLLNVIAEKIHAKRESAFNNSPFFDRYVDCCQMYGDETTPESCFLSSDDVFDTVLNRRYINQNIDNRREQLFQTYLETRQDVRRNSAALQMHGMKDYDRWRSVHDCVSKTQSQFVRERLAENVDMHSNGETAMRYFTQRIDAQAVYLLDEPENSLSVAFQEDLAVFLEDSARFYGCQLIVATHSPIFLAMRDAAIYDLDRTPVQTRPWTQLENVRRYFNFFDSHRTEFLSSEP